MTWAQVNYLCFVANTQEQSTDPCDLFNTLVEGHDSRTGIIGICNNTNCHTINCTSYISGSEKISRMFYFDLCTGRVRFNRIESSGVTSIDEIITGNRNVTDGGNLISFEFSRDASGFNFGVSL